MESILDDRELVGERSENFIPSEGKTFDHGEESDVFEFDDDGESEKGKSTLDIATLLVSEHFSFLLRLLPIGIAVTVCSEISASLVSPTRISDFLIFSD